MRLGESLLGLGTSLTPATNKIMNNDKKITADRNNANVCIWLVLYWTDHTSHGVEDHTYTTTTLLRSLCLHWWLHCSCSQHLNGGRMSAAATAAAAGVVADHHHVCRLLLLIGGATDPIVRPGRQRTDSSNFDFHLLHTFTNLISGGNYKLA